MEEEVNNKQEFTETVQPVGFLLSLRIFLYRREKP
jgi:hypothetical protein